MVKKIVSGGQTGADQGGLVAAKQLGLETGGWMPRGFRTEDGNHPELAKAFGMQEHRSPEYPPRTKANARDSDGTAWFGNVGSRGWKATATACEIYGRPFAVITDADDLKQFVEDFKIKVLNVAGNRASKNHKIHRFTAETIIEALKGYQE